MVALTLRAMPALSAARILRPERPRLADAHAAVAGITHPLPAWDALAARAVIPRTWVATMDRAFTDGPAECVIDPNRPGDTEFRVRVRTVSGRALTAMYGAKKLLERFDALNTNFGREAACEELGPEITTENPCPHPESVAACVALAADPDGILRAEALAREVVRRLAPKHRLLAIPPVWRVASRDGLTARWNREPEILREFPVLPPENDVVRGMRAKIRAELPGLPPEALRAELTRRLWSVFEPERPENPYEPLVALWALGYCLHASSKHGLVLGCPAL